MNKLLSLLGNPWILFTLAVLSFSASIYFLTGMFTVWGIGFTIASIGRYAEIDSDGNVRPRQKY